MVFVFLVGSLVVQLWSFSGFSGVLRLCTGFCVVGWVLSGFTMACLVGVVVGFQ